LNGGLSIVLRIIRLRFALGNAAFAAGGRSEYVMVVANVRINMCLNLLDNICQENGEIVSDQKSIDKAIKIVDDAYKHWSMK